ncbi:MAG: Gx transporter family protein [Oscillospiraceae bacterium]
MKRSGARKVALTGMLFALAIALGIFESSLAPFLGLPPGVKLGLANVVVMYALFFQTRREALALVVLKALFGALTRGAMAGLISLAGGTLSFVIMVLLMLLPQPPSVLLLSIAGALGHNFGQFIAVRFLLGPNYIMYAPVLLVSGVVMGCLTAFTVRMLEPALKRMGYAQAKSKKPKEEPPTTPPPDTKQE